MRNCQLMTVMLLGSKLQKKLQKNVQTSSKQIIIITQKDQNIKLTPIYHFLSTKGKSITVDWLSITADMSK